MAFRAPRGVADILPADQAYWRWLRATAADVAESYGYGEIETPVFEHAGVFLRPGAEGTDLVDKEVYRFEDRGGDDLALRPEGTAGVVRAYIEHGMSSWPQPVRLFYFVSVFRYDRPQAGRYRVHHQFGVETIGDGEPSIDAEVIDLLNTFYARLGLRDLDLRLNSIGDATCRPGYLDKLRAYYADKLDRLCGDCQRRFHINPLRLLDCKNAPCQPFKAGAPKSVENLCEACLAHFGTLRALLSELGIPYSIDPALVRGIDYYTRTAFEFQPRVEGSQSTIGGGGRYDGLIEQLGGQPTPGIGFGTGLERIILNLKEQGLEPPREFRPALDAYVAVASPVQEQQLLQVPALQERAMAIARALRQARLTAVVGSSGRSLRSQMRHADALHARYVLIIGVGGLQKQTVTLRHLESKWQGEGTLEAAIERVGGTGGGAP